MPITVGKMASLTAIQPASSSKRPTPPVSSTDTSASTARPDTRPRRTMPATPQPMGPSSASTSEAAGPSRSGPERKVRTAAGTATVTRSSTTSSRWDGGSVFVSLTPLR